MILPIMKYFKRIYEPWPMTDNPSLESLTFPRETPRPIRPWFLLILPAVYLLYIRNNPLPLKSAPGPPVDTVEMISDEHIVLTESHENQTEIISKLSTLPECAMEDEKKGNTTCIIEEDVELADFLYPLVKAGGCYKPLNCVSKDVVAILVPYRDRADNLEVFLYNIHPFLMRQNLEYRIFVIEQNGDQQFNRGRLFNAGVRELSRFGYWRCLVFHDVDLLPTDLRVRYSCPVGPRHMCAAVINSTESDPKMKMGHITKYFSLGGVSAMSLKHYEQINGYSNLYWGLGDEDDDLYHRIRAENLTMTRYKSSIARYYALPHSEARQNKLRYQMQTTKNEYKKDGLSTVNYKLVSVDMHHLYTRLLVDINPYNRAIKPVFKMDFNKNKLQYRTVFTAPNLLIDFQVLM